jgi:hypothetical protein
MSTLEKKKWHNIDRYTTPWEKLKTKSNPEGSGEGDKLGITRNGI